MGEADSEPSITPDREGLKLAMKIAHLKRMQRAMAMKPLPELTQEMIVELYEAGSLLEVLSERNLGRITPELSEAEIHCVALHNSGTLDLLRLSTQESLSVVTTLTYYQCAHALSRLIPYLESDFTSILKTIDHLVEASGSDGGGHFPNTALFAWYERNMQAAGNTVQAAREGQPLPVKYVAFALHAIRDAAAARRMAHDFSDERRRGALVALSRINDDGEGGYEASLALLGALLDEAEDENLRALVLSVAADLLGKGTDVVKALAVDIIRRACDSGGPTVRRSAAFALRQVTQAKSHAAMDALLTVLASTTVEEQGTIQVVDGALFQLWNAGDWTKASALMAALLVPNEGQLSLANFPCMTSHLSSFNDDVVRWAITWLLSGEVALGRAVMDQFDRTSESAGQPLSVPAGFLPKRDVDMAYLARKVVGWLFTKPVTAASLLVSLMRSCGDATADGIADLLGSILLTCYGSVRDYLGPLAQDERVGLRIATQLAINQAYLDGLRSVPELPELRPSEAQVNIQNERRATRAREVNKEARKHSVLLSMVKTSRILHGAGMISTIYELGGKRRRVETPFHTVGTSVEIPKLEIVDPIGFDEVLTMFRVEHRSS